MPIIKAKLSEVAGQMKHADLLLYRCGWKPTNLLIAAMGRSRYVHAGMVGGDGQLCLHMLQFRGGSDDDLVEIVARNPGSWDWFEANPDNRWPEFNRVAAVNAMWGLIARPYGYRNVLLAAIRHLPIVRLFVRPLTNDNETSPYPPHCADAITRADRVGGVDPVPNLADRVTEPGDLARSQFFRYRATLMP